MSVHDAVDLTAFGVTFFGAKSARREPAVESVTHEARVKYDPVDEGDRRLVQCVKRLILRDNTSREVS